MQARADRFVAHHITETVKPLTDLREADQLVGLTRGIAFRLVENLGVVERREIAADVKALDQEGRAALRRYGVRFGAYHIFIPALLKPAPAGLLTLLWALKHDARDETGYGDVVAMLAQGRTSVITDEAVRAEFYRLAGFRNLGRRAVRVDILERLADLIRPAVYWKQGQEARPEGAYGGSRFHVTPAMMSILGAMAEDMEEILKGLGYRHEAIEADAFSAEVARLEALYAPPKPDSEPAETAPAAEAGDAASEPTVDETAGETAPAAETAEDPATETPADAAVADAPVEAPEVTVPDSAATGQETAPPAAAEAAPAAPEGESAEAEAEEPKPVLVWRQGRNERARPPQRNARGKGGDAQGRNGGKPWQKDGQGKGKPRRDAKGKPPQGGKRPEKRDKAPDPDSPFAKLAALKQQMKT